MDRQAYIVLGMHRSGTSAMTRVLSLSGAALPANLMPSTEGENARGFWESADVVSFDHEMLMHLGSDWDDVRAASLGDTAERLREPFGDRFQALLRTVFGDEPVLVTKDPRVSILAAFWDEQLRIASIEPLYILTLRHPMEVAGSLAVRNGFSSQRSQLLWLNYMVAAERDTRGKRRVTVRYDELLRAPGRTLDTIERTLGRNFPVRTRDADAAIDAFLSGALRHHEAEGFEGLQSRLVREAYDWFVADAAGLSPPFEPMDRVADTLHDFNSLGGALIAEVQSERDALQAALLEQKNGWAAELELARGEFGVARELAGEQAARIAALEAEVDIQRAWRTDTQAALRTLEEQAAGARREADELRRRMSAPTPPAAAIGGEMAARSRSC